MATYDPNTALDLSVVICTYNGTLRLPALLECLRSQQTSYRWEILIVDNNSCDRTREVIQQQVPPANVPLRYCFEAKQGLAFARRRAIGETHSPLIGFLDDDTLPDSHWVNAAVEFARQHPEVGAYGSSISGLYEVPPPAGFARIAMCLAIIERGEQPFQYPSVRGLLPAGAGMVIRRQAWLEQVPAQPRLSGVKGTSLRAKGEDVETLSYIRRGWPIWHNPAMKLAHRIPKERLERSYLLNLCWYIGLSRYPLRRLRYRTWQWPMMVSIYFLSDLRKALHYWSNSGLKRHSSQTVSDVVSACEEILLLSSLWSPFHAQFYRFSRCRWFKCAKSTL